MNLDTSTMFGIKKLLLDHFSFLFLIFFYSLAWILLNVVKKRHIFSFGYFSTFTAHIAMKMKDDLGN